MTKICQEVSSPGDRLNQLLRQCDFEQEFLVTFSQDLQRSAQPSVDAFLENRPEYLKVGKLAMAGALIPFEEEQRLTRRNSAQSWYEYLFSQLNYKPGNQLADTLTLVTFNYDRSLTKFLLIALQSSFNLSPHAAADCLRGFDPIHVYGKLGELKELTGTGRSYSSTLGIESMGVAAESIRLMVEKQPLEGLTRARLYLAEAELIMFLGFGYHRNNVEILHIPERSQNRHLCGSAYGVGNGERLSIGQYFPNQIDLGERSWDVLSYLRESPFLAWAKGATISLPT